MDTAHDVGAVVHGDLGLAVDDRIDVLVVGFGILALDGIDVDAVFGNECRSGVVLGGQRVACAQVHFGTARLEGAHQVGGFGGDMQACADANAFQGLFAFEAFADACKYGHVAVCPQDALDARLRQAHILDIRAHVPFLPFGYYQDQFPIVQGITAGRAAPSGGGAFHDTALCFCWKPGFSFRMVPGLRRYDG